MNPLSYGGTPILVTFWAILKTVSAKLLLSYFLGNVKKNLGYFLFQHLVTLALTDNVLWPIFKTLFNLKLGLFRCAD